MDKQLELLIELQGLDTEISQLVKEKEAIPKEIRALEQRFSEEESRLEAIKRDLEDLQKRRRSQERELEHQGLEMKKRQGRLLEVKTNKEYSAILHEIEGLKEKQSALEDEVLEVLEEIDRQAGQVKRQSERLAQEKAQCEQGRKEWEGKSTETEARLSALLKERANRASGIDPALMQTYMRVFENRQGLAVVPVRERSCSGCFVTLTPQVFQEAKKNDRLITCSNCNRFVYWKEP